MALAQCSWGLSMLGDIRDKDGKAIHPEPGVCDLIQCRACFTQTAHCDTCASGTGEEMGDKSLAQIQPGLGAAVRQLRARWCHRPGTVPAVPAGGSAAWGSQGEVRGFVLGCSFPITSLWQGRPGPVPIWAGSAASSASPRHILLPWRRLDHLKRFFTGTPCP